MSFDHRVPTTTCITGGEPGISEGQWAVAPGSAPDPRTPGLSLCSIVVWSHGSHDNMHQRGEEPGVGGSERTHTHAYTHAPTHTHTVTHTHTHLHTCTHTHPHTCTHAPTHLHTHAHTHPPTHTPSPHTHTHTRAAAAAPAEVTPGDAGGEMYGAGVPESALV